MTEDEPLQPAGRILKPTRIIADPYLLREEELGKAGVTVRRVMNRARGADGSTYVWISRTKSAGVPDAGRSGLRFDALINNR